MLKYLLSMLLLVLLLSPVAAQADGLPFAYVTETNGEITLSIIDATTQEVLHSLENACPLSFSPDKEWLAYYPYLSDDSELLLFNLLTGESQIIGEIAYPFSQWWSGDSQKLAYSHENGDSQALYHYELANSSSELVYQGDYFVQGFQGDFLYYLSFEEGIASLHRWNNEDEILSSIETGLTVAEIIEQASVSPNRQFLAIDLGEGALNLYDINRGEGILFGDVAPITWQPNEAATMVYSFGDNSYFYDLQSDTQTEIPSFTGGYLSWSPDGDYLMEVDTEEERRFRLFDIGNDNVIEIGTYQTWEYPANLWISPHQFVYEPPKAESDNQDLFLYDVLSQERQQLTDRGENYVSFGCPVG